MIPKASQRSGGQDLATHLLNAHDNEYVEVAEVRGAIADDLHGAFAEWEAVAHNLTKCRNYLYSLSVNPALVQKQGEGQLSRDQYRDYADRVEKAMGLESQPRAMVFHIKNGREHCHIVWSRIDARAGKAIHQSFDHDKLMMVTRAFALDHGITLPKGYEQHHEDRKKRSFYETQQERQTGISKEDRIAQVTAAWKQSDSPRAFVRALEEMGYVLATGNRPYVLVDLYGGMNALPKLIDDKAVRTKDIRAFLGGEFPPEALPSVDEAKALVAQYRETREAFGQAQRNDTKIEALKTLQAKRRAPIEAKQAAQQDRHDKERAALEQKQAAERQGVKARYFDEVRRVRDARAIAKPTGLAAFLGKVTGVSFLISQVQRYQDTKRYAAFRVEREGLSARQRAATADLRQRHTLQGQDMTRQLHAIRQVEARELKSYNAARLKDERVSQRQGSGRMPALKLELKPRGSPAVPHKAMHRHRKQSDEKEAGTKIEQRPSESPPQSIMRKAFGAAAVDDQIVWREEEGGETGDGAGTGSAGRGNGRRRNLDRQVQEPVVREAHSTPSSTEQDQHWTELPLANSFHEAARESENGAEPIETGRRIRPSRSSRRTEHDRDENDFERER